MIDAPDCSSAEDISERAEEIFKRDIAPLTRPEQTHDFVLIDSELADGSICVFDVYKAEVIWGEGVRCVPIDEQASIPLAGMALLYGHDLTMRTIEGGAVKIAPFEAS
jgi:hypothetical protein